MWLKSVRLENIKCFEDLELIFTRSQSTKANAKPHRWITLLGENCVGKSTVLQAAALLLAGPNAAREILPRPTGWVRNPSTYGKLTAHICKEADDQSLYGGKQKTRKNFSYTYHVTGDESVKVPLGDRKEEVYTEPVLIEERSDLLSWLRVNAFASGNKGWFSSGYGPFRRLTRTSRILIPGLDLPTRAGNFITLFNEESPLSTFERWMVHLDFRLAKDKEDQQAQKMRSIGKKVITSLLPGDAEIDEVTKNGLIRFRVNGQVVPTVSLSDGFRSVIALGGDLIWRLLQAFPDMDDPTRASGVVLIDELDIHLHPVWKRDIAGWLRDVFPNLQFIVTTHSPLVAIGAGEDALTLRLRMNDRGTVIGERTDDISVYDTERVLKSPAFGLVSTYAPTAQEKMDRYRQLMLRFPDINNQEKMLLDELTEFMKKLQLAGEPPEPGSLLDRMNRFLDEKLPT